MTIEEKFLELVDEFSKGNEHLACRLIEDRPLVYKLGGMEKSYIMVDYMAETPIDDVRLYNTLISESVNESILAGMFPGYKAGR